MAPRLSRIDALNPEQRRTWAAARVWTARQAPYLASAVLALEPVVVEQDTEPGQSPALDLRAFPTDTAWHIYLDPDVLDQTDVPRLGFWLLHQVTHLLRRHANRFPDADAAAITDANTAPVTGNPLRGRDQRQQHWNTSCDAEIDDDLSTGALKVPDDAVTPASLGLPDGWLAEQYWDRLTEPPRDQPGEHGPGQIDPGQRNQGQPNPEQHSPGQRGPGLPNPGRPDPAARSAFDAAAFAAFGPDSESESDPGAHNPPPSSPLDPHDCGTGCDGRGRPWNCGRPGLSATGRKLLSIDVARRVREHSRSRGEVPEGWRRWAEGELEPVVDWRRVLRAAVRRGVADVTGKVDFTYRRPSRRAAALPGVILPSMRQPRPAVAVVIDTSGSMNDAMLAQVLGEVAGLLTGLGIGRDRLHVLCCDAEAYAAQRVFNAREVRLLGGGGTDMGVGLAAAAALRPRPDLVVVLTDGHTPWPARPPGSAKVVVGLLDPAGSVPPWATSVIVEPGQAPAHSGRTAG